MSIRKIALGAVLVSSTAVAALAHGGATGIVKERMDAMGVMKEALKVLTPMMQGQTAYDADVVRAEADRIAMHAGETMTKLFPEGSTDKPSEAKDTIWQDWEGFVTLAEQLRVTSVGLGLSAENGLMMAGAAQGGMMGMGQVGMMGGGSGMMGAGSGMMAGATTPEQYAQMPADGVFAMMGQVCSACHTRFRAE